MDTEKIAPHEMEVFRRFQLNPEKVLFYRRRLRRLDPIPRGVATKLSRLQKRFKVSLSRHEAAIKEIADGFVGLQETAVRLNVTLGWPPPTGLQVISSSPGMAEDEELPGMMWDLETKSWGYCRSIADERAYNETDWGLNDYTECPQKPDEARTAWNCFTVAFCASPLKMARRKAERFWGCDAAQPTDIPGHYVAEYLDVDRKPVLISALEIRAIRRRQVAVSATL